jgi:hypothetical protein
VHAQVVSIGFLKEDRYMLELHHSVHPHHQLAQ